jgi:tripartite-type tricarboxylate transporter receptor subunit TctC
MVTLRVALLALLAAMATSAGAQEWPSRPVRFVVPFPAGGSTDVGARLVGEYLSRSLHQQIVVENKSGANGNIGIETAAKSAADGYTVLVATDAISSNPHVYKMNVDPLKAFTPVIQLSRQPIVLAAHPSLGIGLLTELIALARQQPGLRYATGSGVGAQHMVVQWFASIAGIKLEQVPYRGGAPAINDLIAGHRSARRRSSRTTRPAR